MQSISLKVLTSQNCKQLLAAELKQNLDLVQSIVQSSPVQSPAFTDTQAEQDHHKVLTDDDAPLWNHVSGSACVVATLHITCSSHKTYYCTISMSNFNSILLEQFQNILLYIHRHLQARALTGLFIGSILCNHRKTKITWSPTVQNGCEANLPCLSL